MAVGKSAGLGVGRGSLLAPIIGAPLLIPLFGLAISRRRRARRVDSGAGHRRPAPAGAGSQTVVLAGGCFWGVQGVFEHTKGVTRAVSGYSGGKKETAHYEMVGTERTGHAELVAVTFDPKQISYGKILQIYFSVAHNPTELNYQGPDQRTVVSLGHLLRQRRSETRRRGLYRPTR